MKIAIISTIPIFPAHGGNRARIMTLAGAIQNLGHQLHFVLLPSRHLGECDKQRHNSFFLQERFHFLRRARIKNIFYLTNRFRYIVTRKIAIIAGQDARRFTSVDEIYFSPFSERLRQLQDVYRFDAVIIGYVNFSRAFEAFPPDVLKILDTHDSAAQRFPSNEEVKGFLRADVILAIQNDEAATFRRQLGSEAGRVRVLSHILDIGVPLDLAKTAGATFIGSTFDANIVSLNYFVRDVLPLIVNEEPHFKFFVAGSICDVITNHPSIIKLGRVSTVREAFRGAPLSINPIRKGTGVKIKLLESMSLGIPTVSTKSGLRGIENEFCGGVISVCDTDAEGFAFAVIELFRNRGLREALGLKNREAASRWNDLQLTALRELLGAPKS